MKVFNCKGTDFFIREGKSQGDIDVINEVFGGDTYRLKQLATMINPATIIDVGAHIGTFTVFAKQLWPKARIVAVEPNPESFSLLVKNTEQLEDVVCINAAMRYDESHILTDGRTTTGGGYMADTKKIQAMDASHYSIVDEHVRLVTIEEIMATYKMDAIDLAKFDCEFSERDIFASVSDDAAQCMTHLIGEYHLTLPTTIEMLNAKWPGRKIWALKGDSMLGNFWAMKLPPNSTIQPELMSIQ